MIESVLIFLFLSSDILFRTLRILCITLHRVNQSSRSFGGLNTCTPSMTQLCWLAASQNVNKIPFMSIALA